MESIIYPRNHEGISEVQGMEAQKMETQETEDQVSDLIDILALLLSESSAGYSEHQLLVLLQQPPHEFFSSAALRDPLLLFQTHFLLFHCLYRLKQDWHKQQYADLEISALLIVKQPLKPHSIIETAKQALKQSEPLAQYYLDWSHFSTTTSEDVETLLNSFWRKVFSPTNDQDIQQALTVLELDAAVPTAQLKVQYRRLAQTHHPDKGGNSEHFKKICQAFHQLKQYNALSS